MKLGFRKISVLFMLMLFLSSSSYAVVQQHFCCGQLINISINSLECTPCCKLPNKDQERNVIQHNPCCKDLVVSIDSEDVITTLKTSEKKTIQNAYLVTFFDSKSTNYYHKKLPELPLISHQQDYLRFEKFII